MDFFEAQALAKKRTGRLVVLFALAVVGTIFAGYIIATLIVSRGNLGGGIWQPGLLVAVSVGTIAVVSIGAAVKWAQYRAGGASVAEGLGAKKIDANTKDLSERKLLNVVEEMAIASGLPVPAAYVMEDEEAINAFAAGLTTNDAVVTVTKGTLEKLNRDELQGVIGHEFSHILNGDMRLNMRIGALVFGILVIGLAGRGVLYGMGRGRVRTGRGRGGGQAMVLILAVGIGLLVVGYTGYFFGRLIQAAVSRQREFLADASSVQFTRNPGGIVNALRKIGGYALGSSMQTARSEAIGHFFFAQAFESNFGGLWATHPPLDERIRAIDPSFDGKYFEPRKVVDVENEPWMRKERPADIAGFAPGAAAASVPKPPPVFRPEYRDRKPDAIVASAGSLTMEQLANAQALLENIPAILREAARSPGGATALSYGLVLSSDPAVRSRQDALIQQRTGPTDAMAIAQISAAAASLRPEARLPLAQVAIPSLKTLPEATIETLFITLKELIKADNTVSAFEFALLKVMTHALAFGRRPDAAVIQIYSFNAVSAEIAVVLGAIAAAGSGDEAAAEAAFRAGASQIGLLAGKLSRPTADDTGFAQLDAALDKLATSSPPIKQRLLLAAAHTASADGVLQVEEVELLRAIAATLDVPIPA